MKTKIMFAVDAEGYFFDMENETRVTSCCWAHVTYHDDILCCKVCWEEVDEALASQPILKAYKEK